MVQCETAEVRWSGKKVWHGVVCQFHRKKNHSIIRRRMKNQLFRFASITSLFKPFLSSSHIQFIPLGCLPACFAATHTKSVMLMIEILRTRGRDIERDGETNREKRIFSCVNLRMYFCPSFTSICRCKHVLNRY